MFTYLTPFKKPRLETSSQIETTKLQQGGCEYQKTEKVNFSNFSIPAVFLKPTHRQNSSRNVLSSERVQEKELLPTLDEHSEAADNHSSAFGIREKRKASDIEVCNEPESSSACSLEASNDPNFGFRDHEENYDSPYFSDVSGIIINHKPFFKLITMNHGRHRHGHTRHDNMSALARIRYETHI